MSKANPKPSTKETKAAAKIRGKRNRQNRKNKKKIAKQTAKANANGGNGPSSSSQNSSATGEPMKTNGSEFILSSIKKEAGQRSDHSDESSLQETSYAQSHACEKYEVPSAGTSNVSLSVGEGRGQPFVRVKMEQKPCVRVKVETTK